jgi:hypothetical protein
MENTQQQQQTSPETEYFQTLIKRIETQRNDALNNVALLEAELLKAQKIIDRYKKELDELKGNNSSEE